MWFAPTWTNSFSGRLRPLMLILLPIAGLALGSFCVIRSHYVATTRVVIQSSLPRHQFVNTGEKTSPHNSAFLTFETALQHAVQNNVAGPSSALSQLRDVNFWQRLKWVVVVVVAFLLLQTALIAILLLERQKRWRASLQLAESEERYRNVIEVQTELICRYAPDTTLTFVNDAYCRYFKKTREQLIGSKFIDLIPEHARSATIERIKSLLNNSTPGVNEHEVVRPDGSIGWHQWSNYVISRSKQVELQGIGRDITQRKHAEEALINSEEFNRRIVESTADCVKVLDLQGNLIYMSERGQKLLEIDDIDQFINKSWIDLWDGENRVNARKAIDAAVSGETGSFRGFAPTFGGRPRWWLTVVTPMQGPSGNVERLLAISRDITDQQLALRAIQESEERFAKAFRANPQPMSLTTFGEGRYIDVNDSFLEMSGYSRDDVIGHTSTDLNIFETPGHRTTILIKPFQNGGPLNPFEMKFRTKSGNQKVLLSSAELLELGGEKCILVASTDISERKVLEENLRLSEREFSTLVENSPDVICRLDRQVRFIYVSPGFLKLTDLGAESVIGLTPQELALPNHDWKGFELSCATAIRTKQSSHRATVYKGHHFSTRVIPEFSADGQVESVMTISEDVTHRIRSEEELLQLTARLFNLQDEERRRIARELHDGTAQNLFAISVNLAKLGQLDSFNSESARQLINECLALGDLSLQEIRTLSYLLHPPLLDQAGLVSALQWYVEGFSKRSGIYVDVFAEPIGRLASDVEMALFRVVQEALTNVRRHSGSESANIRLQQRDGNIILEIKDNGTGLASNNDNFEGDTIATGVGIPGMKQRLRQLGGHLKIISTAHGTRVSAVVPVADGDNHDSNTTR